MGYGKTLRSEVDFGVGRGDGYARDVNEATFRSSSSYRDGVLEAYRDILNSGYGQPREGDAKVYETLMLEAEELDAAEQEIVDEVQLGVISLQEVEEFRHQEGG